MGGVGVVSLGHSVLQRRLDSATKSPSSPAVARGLAHPIEGTTVQVSALRVGTEAPEGFVPEGPGTNPTGEQARLEMDLPTGATVAVEVYNTLGWRILRARRKMSVEAGRILQRRSGGLPSVQYLYRWRPNVPIPAPS